MASQIVPENVQRNRNGGGIKEIGGIGGGGGGIDMF